MGIFGDEVEVRSFEPLTFGHHFVKIKLADRDGAPWIKDTAKGPRAMFKLYLESNPNVSSLDGVTFNLNTIRGTAREEGGFTFAPIKLMNKCLGFTVADLEGLVAGSITETECPEAFVHSVAAMWATSPGVWVEIKPDGAYTRTVYLNGEPLTHKGVGDYNIGSGNSAFNM